MSKTKSPTTNVKIKTGLGLRFLRLIELVAALTAIAAVYLWFKFEYPAMQQDRLTNAWTLINQPGQGGKKEILKYLAEQSQPRKGWLAKFSDTERYEVCLLYTSPSPRDRG